MAFIQMTHNSWSKKFRPLVNPATNDIAFDTHGDIDFLRTIPRNRIWTLVDCPEYRTWVIINGFWRINRMEYYVTEVPHDMNDEYNIE